MSVLLATGELLIEDTSLMLRVKEVDDHQAFEMLVRRHRKAIVNFIFRMVQNQPVAEELAQDVFLRVYEVRHGYIASARFSTWLYTLATNHTLKWIRDNRKRNGHLSLDAPAANGMQRQIPDGCAGIDARLVKESEQRRVRSALAQLPARQRAVVVMHKYENRRYEEIAAALGTTVPAIKSLAFRAYHQLRASIDGANEAA
ncbi:MAG: RNA polymerase sigma factor [Bryobacteraceae bacterium]|nr:RNA polymerase sigma factor [Bryobacteraceae bacterium]